MRTVSYTYMAAITSLLAWMHLQRDPCTLSLITEAFCRTRLSKVGLHPSVRLGAGRPHSSATESLRTPAVEESAPV